MGNKEIICPWCYFARMRKDICGIYCTGGFTNSDGSCDHFKSYEDHKREQRQKRKKNKQEVEQE